MTFEPCSSNLLFPEKSAKIKDGRKTRNWLIEWNTHVIERHNKVHVGRLIWQTLHVSLYTIHVCCKQYCCITCIRQLKFQIKHMSLSSICYLLNLWETCLVPENIHAHSKEVYWKSQESWRGGGGGVGMGLKSKTFYQNYSFYTGIGGIEQKTLYEGEMMSHFTGTTCITFWDCSYSS